MNKLRVIDLEELPWQPHPTIGTIMTRVVETAATHPQADVLVANVAPSGAIPWHVHEHSQSTSSRAQP